MTLAGALVVALLLYLSQRDTLRQAEAYKLHKQDIEKVKGAPHRLDLSLLTKTQECALYAGPLRWRGHPAGRMAPTTKLLLLPLEERPKFRNSDQSRFLTAFPPSALELLPAGPFAQAATTNNAFLRSISHDRLFYSFRATANLPQPHGAKPFGGWESPGAGIRGHFVGHYVSALALAAASGDVELLQRSRDALRILAICQRAHTAAGRVGYLAAFPEHEFEKAESLGVQGNVWVPHYASQKVLSGLLEQHEIGMEDALPIALSMASHIVRRAVKQREEKGENNWAEALNYEVGALGDVFVSLARYTKNESWLHAAALFDRNCFTGALATAGLLHNNISSNLIENVPFIISMGGVDEPQSDAEARAAFAAMQGMHANAQLAYILGAANRFEATSEERAGLATVGFWRQLQSTYTFLTGGSSFQEEWRGNKYSHDAQADALHHRGKGNVVAHDHQESCVTHNSMLLAKRLVSWEGVRISNGEDVEALSFTSLLSLCGWYERALYNGVLGTQRGTQPGALIYMLPLGGGVSKAGGSHGWSNTYGHFWCCMGSAIEAFGRLNQAVFWLGGSSTLYVLQLVPTTLKWEERGVKVKLEADIPGELRTLNPGKDAIGPLETRLCVTSISTSLSDPKPIRIGFRMPQWATFIEARVGDRLFDAKPQSLLHVNLVPDGLCLSIRLQPALELRPSSEPLLKAVFWGPLLLAALTKGDRRVYISGAASFHKKSYTWLTPVPQSARNQLRSLRVASFMQGGSELVLAHNEIGKSIRLDASVTPLPTRAGRRGGSDEAMAATWRVLPSRGSLQSAIAGLVPIALESFDFPASFVTVSAVGQELLLLHGKRRGGAGNDQLWWLRRVNETRDTFNLESFHFTGMWLARSKFERRRVILAPQSIGGSGSPLEIRLGEAFADYAPVSFWGTMNISSSCLGLEECDARSYLFVPLNGILDEHYSAHICVISKGSAAPRWCK